MLSHYVGLSTKTALYSLQKTRIQKKKLNLNVSMNHKINRTTILIKVFRDTLNFPKKHIIVKLQNSKIGPNYRRKSFI